MSLNHQTIGNSSVSERQLNRLFIFVIVSGFAIALTPFILLIYDARGSLLTEWENLQDQINQWAISGLASSQSRMRDGSSGLATLRPVKSEKTVLLPQTLGREKRFSVVPRQSQGDRILITQITEVPQRQVTVPVTVEAPVLSDKNTQSIGTEEDLRQFLTKGQFHRVKVAPSAIAPTVNKGRKVIEIVQALPREEVSTRAADLVAVQGSGDSDTRFVAKTPIQPEYLIADTRLAPFTVSVNPNESEAIAANSFQAPVEQEIAKTPVPQQQYLIADTRLAPFTVSVNPNESEAIAANSFQAPVEQEIAKTPVPQQQYLIADTRLAPFTVSVKPEDSISPFQEPVTSGPDVEIARTPIPQQQYLIADTRLAPFTVSVNPNESEAIAANSFQAPVEQEIAKTPVPQQQYLIADTRLAPFTVSVNPNESEAIAANSFQAPVEQEIAKTPVPQQQYLIADTRLAPFTVSVKPEDSISPFQEPVTSGPDVEIAKTPVPQQQYLIADTRLAPFTVSVNPNESEAIAANSFQAPAVIPPENNQSKFPLPETDTTALDTGLSAIGAPIQAFEPQSGSLQPLPSIPLSPLPVNRLISQGGSTERNLTPTTPVPSLPQVKEPDPTIDIPRNLIPFQEPTQQTTPQQDLFSPYRSPITTEQVFTDTELFDTFQDINLNNYYDTAIAPLRKAIEQTQPSPPEGTIAQQINQIMERSLSGSSLRYPWILNSSDNLSFAPLLFRPKDNQFYFNIDLRFTEPNPVVNQITFGGFPYDDQFYWLLDQNKVVIETFGGQGGIIYQGKQQNVQLEQTLLLAQSLIGFQAVWVIPYDLQTLFKPEELAKFTVLSIAGELTNPNGTSAGPVVIDSSSITGNNSNVVYLPDPSPQLDNIGIASTFNPNGGGASFGNLAVKNAPLILQAFPTTDLRPLFGQDFVRGAIVPKEKLAAAGISFGDIFKGEPAKFTAPVTSVPGIKIAQPNTFDNQDLLKVLTNPYLSQPERDYHYLNSIQWLSTGTREPEVSIRTLSKSENDWYRLFFSAPHNRIMLKYSPDEVEATYTNLYSSPGVSFTFPYDGGELDGPQTLNSSLGMVMGWIFDAFNVEDLDESLDQAKEERNNEQFFAPLKTKMSSQDRKLINQRLNANLAYATLGSSLNQVSGFITFPSVIKPTESSIFQIKTGNIQRAVQFLGSEVGDWVEGDVTLGDVRFSNRDFGPLTFLGSTLPVAPTYTRGGVPQTSADTKTVNQVTSNSSFASQVILISPEGRQYIKNFNPNNITEVPTTIKSYDLAFDRIVLERRDKRIINNSYFNGYLYLPTIELVYAGTSDDFNYTLNVGSWFNVNSTSAPGVRYNNLGIQEPTVGFYTNAIVSSNTTSFDLDENNQVEGISSHAPLLRVNWNSANNDNNPWQISASYTYSRQTRDLGLSLTGGIGYIPQYGNGPFIGLLYGKLGLPFGLSANVNLELGEQIYYNFGLLQQVWENFSLGPYVSNYYEINQGFNSRELLFNYGGIVQHQFPDSPITMTAQIGTSDNGMVASIKGGIRF